MNINEAKLLSFVTSLVKEELDESLIYRLFNLTRDCYPVPDEVEPVKFDLKPLFDFMLGEKKIDAIREHRRLTGAGLKESKEEVERIMDKIKGE